MPSLHQSYQAGMYIPNTNNLVEGGSFATLLMPGHLGKLMEINVGTGASPLIVTYRLAKLKTGVTFAVGEVCYWDDRDDYIVTNVQAGNMVAGFIPAGGAATPAPTYTFTALQYAFLVVKGRRAIKGIDSLTVAADTVGKAVVPSATAGRVDVVTASTMNAVIARTAGAQDATTKLFLADVMVPDLA